VNSDCQEASRISSCFRCNTHAVRSPCFEHDINHWYGLEDRDSIPCKATRSRHAAGPNYLPVQWIPVGISMKVMRSERETDHMSSWRGAYLTRGTTFRIPVLRIVTTSRVSLIFRGKYKY
jgi:hypothetical protein